MAQSLLQHGRYHPQFSSDIWALGQLMLQVIGGGIPEAQWQLQNSIDYLNEVEQGYSCPTQHPGQRKHLEYLSDLLSAGNTDYAAQVRSLTQAALTH